MIGNAEIATACAGCGARTMHPKHWARRHDTLLCPDCDARLASRSDALGLRLARAEQRWDKLWQRVEEALGKSA